MGLDYGGNRQGNEQVAGTTQGSVIKGTCDFTSQDQIVYTSSYKKPCNTKYTLLDLALVTNMRISAEKAKISPKMPKTPLVALSMF